jgi:hypothetical protein
MGTVDGSGHGTARGSAYGVASAHVGLLLHAMVVCSDQRWQRHCLSWLVAGRGRDVNAGSSL